VVHAVSLIDVIIINNNFNERARGEGGRMYVEKHGAVSVVDGTGQTSANNRGEAEQTQDLAQLLPGAYGLLEQWIACHVARRHQPCAMVQI
jgi:hypothetical protein